MIDITLIDLTDPREPDIGEAHNQQEAIMPSYEDVYPSTSTHLKAEDLRNSEVKVSIETASVQKIGEDQKLVLTFKGKEKDLVLNKTNAGRIASALGSDYDSWPGNEIVLYPDITDFGGKPTPCIRVKASLKQVDSELIPF